MEKVKLHKVITGNECKECIIPELKALESEAKPDIVDAIVAGKKSTEYINSVVTNKTLTKFKILGNTAIFNSTNIEEIKEITGIDM